MNKNTNIFEKYIKLAEYKGFKNVQELALFLGYSSAEKIYRLNRSENNKPSFDMMLDISNKFDDINLNWFIADIGEMVSNPINPVVNYVNTPISTKDIEAVSHIDDAEILHPKDTSLLHPILHPTHNLGMPKVVTIAEDGKELIPFVGIKAAAGYLDKYSDEHFIQDLPAIRLQGFKNGTFRAFEVEGHSMLPTIFNGSIAVGEWVENVSDIRDRRIYIIVTHRGIVIKRVLNRVNLNGKLIIISDNANKNEYPNDSIEPAEIKEIWYLRGAIQFNFTEPSEIFTRVNELEGKVSILYDLYQQNKGLK